MTRHAKLLLGGVAVAALGLGAAGAIARHGHHGHGFGGMHGGMFGPGMGSMGKFCRDGRTAEMADLMLVRLEYRVKPTDAQKAGFEELKSATRAAAGKLAAGCPARPAEPAQTDGPRPRPSPVERLANAEAMTAATLDAIKTVRPAAEKFYATLSEAQKTALNERPHRWGRGKGKSDRGERGAYRDQDREPGGPEGEPAPKP
ncbi:MAG: Spy/CpxP family protein refolding chaperone [Hyphomicrobium sp.]